MTGCFFSDDQSNENDIGKFSRYLFVLVVIAWAYYLTYCFLLQQQMLFRAEDKLCINLCNSREQIALYPKKEYDILNSHKSQIYIIFNCDLEYKIPQQYIILKC